MIKVKCYCYIFLSHIPAYFHIFLHVVILGGLVVNVLAIGRNVRRFKTSRAQWIFKGDKILSTPSFGGKVKPSIHVIWFYIM
jgi:hypothetical protein